MQPETKHRKRRDVNEEVEPEMAHDESNWLVSYADMMTLLFGFFVLMYSFSKLDKDKFKVVRKEVSTYFGAQMEEDETLPIMREEIKRLMGASEVDEGAFQVQTGDQSLVLQMNNELLFQSGSAEIQEKFEPVIQNIFKVLFAEKSVDKIVVEGHTDAVPIKSFIYPSNWELSSARGARLVRSLEKFGIQSQKMTVHGFGDSQPLVPNKDKKNRWIRENLKKNRRVLIKVDFGDRKVAAKDAENEGNFKPIERDAPKRKSRGPRKSSSRKKDLNGARDVASKAVVSEGAKVKGAVPIDKLKNRLLEAQKKFKQANKKAIELKKKRAAEKKLRKKIEELEKKTKNLESLDL